MNQTCKQCLLAFDITDTDLAFYDKVSPVFSGKKELIPPPTLCPDCRMQRRLAFRNERTLHHRTCSSTGKAIISMYPADAPFPVFENDEWWKDGWSALDYGCAFDFNRPFFKQFKELFDAVPKMARVQQGENPNSQYTNCASNNKNCYLIFSSNGDEDCMYGTWVNSSKDCVDCHQVVGCQLCHDCIDCDECYNCRSCTSCVQCADCMFSRDCLGCKNCFGCANLRNKEYHIFNQPYSKEEYAKKIAELHLDSYAGIEAAQEVIVPFIISQPYRFYQGVQNESVTGDHIFRSKNADECFDCINLEDCKWCTNCQHFKDSYDITYYGSAGSNELLYEGEGVGHTVVRSLFCKLIWGGSSDMMYCYECFASNNCFGCTGLKRAQYCILNKQYTKEEYETLVPKIIEHMQQTDEWGEFFPLSLSPIGYNESVAIDYFPLEQEAAAKNGWTWGDETNGSDQFLGPAYELPDRTADAPDDVIKQILRCKETNRPFKIVPQELAFYRKMNIPLPRLSPDQRHRARMARRNPRKLWDRTCANCQKAIQTTYAPDRPEIIFCEECYLASAY